MWDEGVLGDDHPKQLCDTVLFLLGMNLVLHGGEEHRRLQWPGFNPQITIGNDSDGLKYLIFDKDVRAKTNQGGLDCREHTPHKTYVYKNLSNPKHCPVRLYTKYCSLIPKIGSKADLYLHPLAKPLKHQ